MSDIVRVVYALKNVNDYYILKEEYKELYLAPQLHWF